jgi:GcrA cell cycle regulator
MDWNQAEVESLKDLTAQGFSASQIAAKIGHGLTRNAVIGKWRRLGDQITVRFRGYTEKETEQTRKMWISGHLLKDIAAAVGKTPRSIENKITEFKENRGEIVRRRAMVRLRKRHPPAALASLLQAPKPRRPKPAGPTVTFRELREHHCRYIHGDADGANTLFCSNEKIPNLSYCPEHFLLCTTTRAQH